MLLFGRLEIRWLRVGTIVPNSVDFTRPDAGLRLGLYQNDVDEIREELRTINSFLEPLVGNQGSLDLLMREVGSESEKGARVLERIAEHIAGLPGQMDQTLSLIQMLPLIKTELEKRTESLNQVQEDLLTTLRREVIPLLSQRPAAPAPAIPYGEMIATYMADLNATEEPPAPSGRRIWSKGRVRVYESRAGGGEEEVRAALNEIMRLRGERKDYEKSVDLLAVPVEDMRFEAALSSTFIEETVRAKISLIPPDCLPTFVRLCNKKPEKEQGNTKTIQVDGRTVNIETIRRYITRAIGKLKSNNKQEAEQTLNEALGLLGKEKAGPQGTTEQPKGDARAAENKGRDMRQKEGQKTEGLRQELAKPKDQTRAAATNNDAPAAVPHEAAPPPHAANELSSKEEEAGSSQQSGVVDATEQMAIPVGTDAGGGLLEPGHERVEAEGNKGNSAEGDKSLPPLVSSAVTNNDQPAPGEQRL